MLFNLELVDGAEMRLMKELKKTKVHMRKHDMEIMRSSGDVLLLNDFICL